MYLMVDEAGTKTIGSLGSYKHNRGKKVWSFLSHPGGVEGCRSLVVYSSWLESTVISNRDGEGESKRAKKSRERHTERCSKNKEHCNNQLVRVEIAPMHHWDGRERQQNHQYLEKLN